MTSKPVSFPTVRKYSVFAGLLYAATSLFAIPLHAEPDWTQIEALKAGQMKGLVIHDRPQPSGTASILSPSGETTSLNAFAGRLVLLNFWATWCGPCRAEMPTLDALQTALGGADFSVELIASGPRNEPEKIASFFAAQGIEALQSHRDPNADLSREMGILGLPITVILAPDGTEIARFRGDADWSSPEAIALISALIKSYANDAT